MLSTSLMCTCFTMACRPQANSPPVTPFSTRATAFLRGKLPLRAFAFALPSLPGMLPLSYPASWCCRDRKSTVWALALTLESGVQEKKTDHSSLTLKAQIFPVISMQSTVKLGASQLPVDGLEDSAMHWVSAIQATCPKTHPCSLWDCPSGEHQEWYSQGRSRLRSRRPVLLYFYPLAPALHPNMINARPLG